MTRIDFYILPADTVHARHLFACRLIEKAYHLGHQVYVHTKDADQQDLMDELLWSFRPSSFLPHAKAKIGAAVKEHPVAVEIGCEHEAGDHGDLLINLSQEIPPFFDKFQRLSEIVVQEPQILQTTRKSYRFYQSHGYSLKRHDLRN